MLQVLPGEARRIFSHILGRALCDDAAAAVAALRAEVDDPVRGLDHIEVVRDHGNSVVVIEHNLDVIKTADWVIDLGPEGGDGGGRIIAQGTPEDLAENPASFTGQYLKHVLEKKKAA